VTGSSRDFLLRVLLPVLLVVAAAILVGVKIRRLSVFETRLADTKQEMDLYSSQTVKAESLNQRVGELKGRLVSERARFFKQGEVDPAIFGMALKQILLEHGLSVDSYKITDDAGRPSLELVISGQMVPLAEFLCRVSNADKYYAVDYLSINALQGRGEIRATLRITYAVLEAGIQETIESLPAEALFSGSDDLTDETRGEIAEINDLFVWYSGVKADGGVRLGEKTEGLQRESSEQIDSTPVEDRPQVKAQWLQYVGSVVQQERQFFIFKDIRSNRIYRLTQDFAGPEGWRYLKRDGETHYLEKDGTIYLVDR
jgi:hypothetical protein